MWTGFDETTSSHVLILETAPAPTVLIISDDGVTVEKDAQHYIGTMLQEELGRAEQIIELNNLFGNKQEPLIQAPEPAPAEPVAEEAQHDPGQ
jgi:hypothetical protein